MKRGEIICIKGDLDRSNLAFNIKQPRVILTCVRGKYQGKYELGVMRTEPVIILIR